MLRTPLTIVLIVLTCGSAFPRQPAGGSVAKTCSFSGIYRKDGWTVPGMPAAKKSKRVGVKDMPGVFVTMLTPIEPQTMMTEVWCPPDGSGALHIEEEPIGVLSLLSFDFDGRVFAYGVRFGTERIENGTRVDAGMESYVMFYDLDGSGHFTLRKGTRGILIPDFIPDWVQKGASAAPNK